MIDFSALSALTVPEGDVVKLSAGGTLLWEKQTAAAPRYPFANGRWEYDGGSWIEITNGNHVHYYAVGTKRYFNLSNIEQNTTTATELDNINSLPIWFTIPSGSECVLTASNVSGYLSDANFRLANATKSSTFFIGDGKSIRSVSVTTTEDIDIGCFFTYPVKAGEVEYDVEFTVNGERWI